MRVMREILLHAGVVCSFVCIAAKILDWYNPFMDFSGHIAAVQMMLCLIVVLSAALETTTRRVRTRHAHRAVGRSRA